MILVENQENYNKKIAPFTFDKVNNVNIPVNINVSMSVIDIIKIEEVDHVYILKFRLVLEWYLFMQFIIIRLCAYKRYDFRIKYFNLKKTRSQNSLALEDVERIWIPFLVFDNTESNEATKVMQSKDIPPNTRLLINSNRSSFG